MTFLGFTGLINFITSSALAVLVFRKCPRRDVGTAYAVLNLTIASFSAFYFIWQCASTPDQGFFYLRMLTVSGMWINQGLLYLNGVFFGWTTARRRVLWLAAFANMFFSILNFTNAMYSHVVPRYELGFWPTAVTGWFVLYLIFWHCELLYAFGDLIATRSTLEGHKKDQVTYLIVAFAIGYIGGITNWPMWFNVYVPPYPNILISVYTMIVAYAMIRHQLMDITVVIKKTLQYSIVSVGLASVYAGVITLLARLLENQVSSPDLFSITATLSWIGENLKISFAYSCLVTSLFSISLGVFVWLKGMRKPASRMWALTCFSIGIWSLGLGMLVRAPTWNNAYLWGRWIQYPGAIMIPILFVHFVMLVVEVRSNFMLWLGYSLAGLQQILNATGHLVSIKTQAPFKYYTLALGNYWIFVLYFFVMVLFAHGLLFWKIFTPEKHLRNQVRYILLAMSIGFCGGSTAFFPVFNIPIFPYGVYAVPIYVLVVSYAIFKHQLLDINVVIRKTLLYSLVSATLASIYVATITLLAQTLGARHGSASAFSSALAAIFITLLFNPLRVKTQRWIDHQFPREHLDPDLLQETAGSFAHEMKRPLTKISFPAQLALMELEHVKSGEKTWEEFLPVLEQRLQFIVSQSMDAGYVIEAIRELSSSALPFEPVNLRRVVDSALVMNKDLLEKHRISVICHLQSNLPSVFGRAKQLEIVFINLIKNAAEAMSDLPSNRARELRIEGGSDQAHVIISVADMGRGIESTNAEKLFTPRYSTKGHGGTGLGLYLSRQIIDVHSGTIEVFSQESGTIFTIKLPVGH